MKKITLKLTMSDVRLIADLKSKNASYGHKLITNNSPITYKEISQPTDDPNIRTISVTDVDEFRDFLNDEMDRICDFQYYMGGEPHRDKNDFDREEELYDDLKSILSKLDKAVVLNNLQKQITKVEEIDKDFCDMVAEGCNSDEGDGQFYNGVRIDEDTILVLSTWYDRTSNSEDYFHYSISKDELVPVDAEMDEKYRDLFEDCNMLDYTDCFYIMGVSPTKDNKAVIDYGDEYIDTIVNLDVVQNDEPKNPYECTCGCDDVDVDGGDYEKFITCRKCGDKWTYEPDDVVQNDEPKSDDLKDLKKQISILEEENCKMRDTLILYNIDEKIWEIEK